MDIAMLSLVGKRDWVIGIMTVILLLGEPLTDLEWSREGGSPCEESRGLPTKHCSLIQLIQWIIFLATWSLGNLSRMVDFVWCWHDEALVCAKPMLQNHFSRSICGLKCNKACRFFWYFTACRWYINPVNCTISSRTCLEFSSRSWYSQILISKSWNLLSSLI